ncbi:haloacid dehalogenase type II [Tersicoccus sp. MR15.9]|uniref:haloacid dehalogenase type II n=1 Tax=Tersicoccus mangrovi TaxID=3121635 RepID=UPI002FE6727E
MSTGTGESTGPVETIVFDVNETLSDMAPLGAAFEAVGAPAELAGTWFAGVLRDGFAAALTGDNVPFATVAQDSAARLLTARGIDRVQDAVGSIMEAMQGLGVHPDVVPGIAALRSRAELVTLSNGATTVARGLLERAGVLDAFGRLLSVEDAPAWKPAGSSYAYAAQACGRAPERMLLVAVHPWDIHGAHAAGLRTAWINRDGGAYPAYLTAPDLEAPDLPGIAARLDDLG